MKLIVGLGNPSAKYNFTRHNFGFLALDFYFKKHSLKWHEAPKFDALSLKTTFQDEDYIFIKPQDFYNLSGDVVQKFARFYKITPTDILVVCDDFNLPFGEIRYRASGSAGGNNGLKSIIASLGTDQFPRLRLGTGNDALRQQIGDVDFVLSRFTPEEKSALPELLSAVSAKIDELI